MSLSETYSLASRVRAKLNREAANPRASLHNLVTQANMLDNIMDHIDHETHQRVVSAKKISEVAFDESHKTSVTEYEVDPDSDSDSEDEDEYALEYESDEDDFSDEEELLIEVATVKLYKQSPSLTLTSILEEEEEESLPELCRTSLGSEDEEDLIEYNAKTVISGLQNKPDTQPKVASLFHCSHEHVRHNAIYSMESIF